MDQTFAIAQQIRGNFGEVETAPEFSGERVWLTVYLSGRPEQLARLVDDLEELGWTNLTDWDGGFIYPKLETQKSADAALDAMTNFCRVTQRYGARVELVDADTGSDVVTSRFITLYESS